MSVTKSSLNGRHGWYKFDTMIVRIDIEVPCQYRVNILVYKMTDVKEEQNENIIYWRYRC